MPNAKEQLELLAAHQEEFELFLKELTGLTVRVHLYVHTADNSEQNLYNLFEASLALPDFEQKITTNRSWFTHKDLNRHISVFMPEDFNDPYPYPEDDEGYANAVEVENTNTLRLAARRRAGKKLTHNTDKTPF